MDAYGDNRTWRERLYELANPVDYGEDSLPPVDKELVDLGYAFMERAEERGVDHLISPQWDDNAVDISVNPWHRSPYISILICYEDEWGKDGYLHKPIYLKWFNDTKSGYHSADEVAPDIDAGIDWLLDINWLSDKNEEALD